MIVIQSNVRQVANKEEGTLGRPPHGSEGNPYNDSSNRLYPATTEVRQTRATARLTEAMEAIASESASLTVLEPLRFRSGGREERIPRYALVGPRGGGDTMPIGIFAGIHGDEPAGSFALVRLAQLLEQHPEVAEGYCLFLYPVCNPTGFERRTRVNQAGLDLNREFWRGSAQAEVALLEAELRERAFAGIISLHSDDTSDGVYGYAHGPVLTEHLVRPALAAASELLPRNRNSHIDGFPAEESIIKQGFEGILSAPPRQAPKPFEVILETPQHAPQCLQEAAFVAALKTILEEHRRLSAYAASL